MRLNVYLQKAGVGSRREAERMVADGRIAINGVKAEATTPVNDGDKVLLDGKPIAPASRDLPRLFLLHKPVDVLVTNRDQQGRTTVFELPTLQDKKLPRVMSVGRLDINSEGLLVLSSDGPLAQIMMHPDTALPRLYRVRVKGKLTELQLEKLKRGITIEGVRYLGAEFIEEPGDSRSNTWYRVTLREGKNREIRKLFNYFGCLVNRLIRTQYGPFELGSLKAGELREVPSENVKRFLTQLEGVRPSSKASKLP
jgi:23S rRNA pseudouridine2605 synthase